MLDGLSLKLQVIISLEELESVAAAQYCVYQSTISLSYAQSAYRFMTVLSPLAFCLLQLVNHLLLLLRPHCPNTRSIPASHLLDMDSVLIGKVFDGILHCHAIDAGDRRESLLQFLQCVARSRISKMFDVAFELLSLTEARFWCL